MASFRGFAAAALWVAAGVSLLPAQVLTLPDGTPVRLRLMQTVSSANTHEGETVDFEVTEPVVVRNLVVIPEGSVALGKVTKVEPRRRFGRSGALEISIDSVRLADGSRAPLRAEQEKGAGPIGGGRLAATIAVSPVLVWVKGKDVTFPKGTETTAYINGDAHLDEAQLRRQLATPSTEAAAAGPAQASADRLAGRSDVLTNSDIIQMQKAGIAQDVILAKIRTSSSEFRTNPQDLIQLKQAGVSDEVIAAMVDKSGRGATPVR